MLVSTTNFLHSACHLFMASSHFFLESSYSFVIVSPQAQKRSERFLLSGQLTKMVSVARIIFKIHFLHMVSNQNPFLLTAAIICYCMKRDKGRMDKGRDKGTGWFFNRDKASFDIFLPESARAENRRRS